MLRGYIILYAASSDMLSSDNRLNSITPTNSLKCHERRRYLIFESSFNKSQRRPAPLGQAFRSWAKRSNYLQLYPVSLTSASRSRHRVFLGRVMLSTGLRRVWPIHFQRLCRLFCSTVIWHVRCHNRSLLMISGQETRHLFFHVGITSSFIPVVGCFFCTNNQAIQMWSMSILQISDEKEVWTNTCLKLWLHVQFLQASLLNCLQFFQSAARILACKNCTCNHVLTDTRHV